MFDGPINGERFRAYVEQFLVPTSQIQRHCPSSTILAPIKEKPCGKPLRRPALAFLAFFPNTRPTLNPIEQAFAKIKGFLRKAAPRIASAPTPFLTPIAQAPRVAIKPAECKNYLAAAGYASA